MPLAKPIVLNDRMVSNQRRRFRLRTLVALSSLPLFGVVAAFGLAPDSNTLNIEPQLVVEPLALPAGKPDTAAGAFHREIQIQPGETLAGALARLSVDDTEIQRLLAFEPLREAASTMRAGNRLQASTLSTGQIESLKLQRTQAAPLVIRRSGDAYVTETAAGEQIETRVVMRSGRIYSSLFGATDSAGIPDSIADKLADTFSTEIDFRDDLRRGDTFSVVYTMNYRNGEPVGVGKLLAAEFVNAGKVHQAMLYTDPFGREDYYGPNGESFKKGFLRSPLEFSRVTSNFTNSRKHPIYGFHRAHTGTDFGAPTGTRVKATGDAVVEFASRRGGYGNLIVLRHPNGYETYYAHLSGFASGIRPGRSVSQGDLIGYVGTTGASTGPHLHYEVRIAGVPYNPLTVKLPISGALSVAQKMQFERQTAGLSDKLALLRGTNLAALD